MSKRFLIIGAIILGVLGISFYVSQEPADQQKTRINSDKHPSTSSGQSMMDKDEHNKMMPDQTRYVEYSKKSYDETAGKRRVLFFYANWCPTCRPTDANFKENLTKIPEDVVVIRVNYNDTDTDREEKDLAQKYGVTYQHTFVQIDKDGIEVTKWNGGQIDELLNNLK